MSNEGQIRQGDIVLSPAGNIDLSAGRTIPRSKGRIVLALGERTGHAHVIEASERDVEFIEIAGKRYINVLAPTKIQHEEHAWLDVPPGIYEVRVQRVYTPQAIQNVAD